LVILCVNAHVHRTNCLRPIPWLLSSLIDDQRFCAWAQLNL
jgi:hypothetical protein